MAVHGAASHLPSVSGVSSPGGQPRRAPDSPTVIHIHSRTFVCKRTKLFDGCLTPCFRTLTWTLPRPPPPPSTSLLPPYRPRARSGSPKLVVHRRGWYDELVAPRVTDVSIAGLMEVGLKPSAPHQLCRHNCHHKGILANQPNPQLLPLHPYHYQGNPLVNDGSEQVSAFDLTEEVDTGPAAQKLSTCVKSYRKSDQ